MPHDHDLSPHRPATASINVSRHDSVLAAVTPSSLPAFHPDDFTPHQPEEPLLVIEFSSSYPTQLVLSNPATLLNSAAATLQPPLDRDCSIILSMANTNPHPTLAAATSTPQPVFTPSSNSTIDLQHTDSTDHPLSLSTVHRMLFSSSATPLAGNTRPVDSRSFPTSSSNQTPPNRDQGLPPAPANSGITIPLLSQQRPYSSGPTNDALDDTQGHLDPTSTEASRYPPQPAGDSAPDLATDRLPRSRDPMLPSHDLGRSL